MFTNFQCSIYYYYYRRQVNKLTGSLRSKRLWRMFKVSSDLTVIFLTFKSSSDGSDNNAKGGAFFCDDSTISNNSWIESKS